MKFAIIKTGGKQYKVSEGDVLEVERLNVNEGRINFEEVLLYATETDLKIGKPFLNDVVVKATVLNEKRGKKVVVSKYKAKAKYRRSNGHRQHLSEIKIDEISSGSVKKEEKKEKKESVKKETKKK